jgi:DNA primase
MIPEEAIADLRARVDLKALVGEYVRLKKSGASWKGLCPFHNEKSPSFYVHPERGFFHCFGCGASGDVFAFVMRLEGLAFPDVARRLAERAGVELPVADPAREQEHRKVRAREERFVAVVEAAAGFYLRQLDEHPLGPMAREVWRARGITDETAASFRLGYAPHGWDGLVGFLRQHGYTPGDAEAVGLVVPRRQGDGYYDRFRHRLMFPITDHQGRIVAFSGRALDPPPGAEPEREPGAKYVNSPEGPLYKKGQILYGLHEGRVEIRRRGWAVICEGNFDLVALHQGGFANAVAPMGTALTEDQAKLLRRYAERVVLLFDGDAAGRKAVRTAFDVLAKAGLDASVVALPPGEDPDSFLRNHGPDELLARVDAAPGIIEHLIDDAASHGIRDASDKARAIASLGPVLAKVSSSIEGRLHVERIARRFGINDVEAVRRQLRQGLRQRREERAEVDESASRPQARRPRTAEFSKVELGGLGVVLDLDLWRSPEAKRFGELLTSPELCAIFDTASRLVEERGGVEAPALLQEVQDNEAAAWLGGRLAKPEHTDEVEGLEVLRKCIPLLEKRWGEARKRQIQEGILTAVRAGDQARANELRVELQALLRGAAQRTGSRGDDGDESSRFEDHDDDGA